jgi:hypothetical protein
VEVLVASVQPTYFISVLGIKKATVSARAVAGNLGRGPGSGCIYALDPNSDGIEGVNINGNATLYAPQCGILDNGNFNTSGNALTVTAGTFDVSGTWPEIGKGNVTCTYSSTCPVLGTPLGADPLSYLTPPPKPGTSFGSVTTSGTQTLQPGEYSSITFGKNSTVTLTSGIYYIDGSGGITFNGDSTVTGSGVMFYFTCPSGQTSCSGGPTINATGGGDHLDIELSAQISGPYCGILFYQNPIDTTGPSLGGDDNSMFQGALYFPKAEVTFFGNDAFNSTANYTILVAAAIALSGHPYVTLNSNYSSLPGGVSIIKNSTLVE